MVSLTIDGMQVHFKQDISFEYYSENPFFTKSGDYTYDIDIDLSDPVNQVIYKHIDRLQSLNKPTGRKACLYDGCRIICYGTEILLKKEDLNIKIQIVSGNSELNYFYAGDTRVRDLDFGTIPQPTPEYAASVADCRYPEANYVFPMIVTKDNTLVVAPDFNNDILYFGQGAPCYSPNTKFYPQPFLLYYVEKIVEIVGYKIAYNCLLEEERWKRLIIANGYDSLEYAKLLPDWSADEFITNCEKFFNVIFFVDSIKNEVHILSAKKYYNDLATIILDRDEILEEFDRDFDTDDSELYINYNNVEYELPDDTGYKYASIDSAVLDKCTIIEKDNLQAIVELEDDNWDHNFFIYHDVEKDLYFIKTGSKGSGLIQVMAFQSFTNGKDSDDMVSLKIVPALTWATRKLFERQGVDNPFSDYFGVFSHPLVDYYDNSSFDTFRETIVQGITDNASDIMKVTFYTGLVKPKEEPFDTPRDYYFKIPMCVSQKWFRKPHADFVCIDSDEMKGNPQNMTLALNGKDGRVALDFNSFGVDTSQEHIIRIITNKELSPTSVYIIDNRRFYCKSLKYTIENGEKTKIVEGRFFPVS